MPGLRELQVCPKNLAVHPARPTTAAGTCPARRREDPEVVRWAAAGDPTVGQVIAQAARLGFDTVLRLGPRSWAVFTVDEVTAFWGST
ncbi:hypothetical protein [Streptomyces sp. NPDC050534]|uniref:hypothetical protein n=1 Tax=Streptomyces sp. NPDC050534 TaxID=3365625 RepID=UPI00378D3C0E